MSNSLKLFYQNTRGLRTKMIKLKATVTLRNYDITCLTETWLSDKFESESIFDDTQTKLRTNFISSLATSFDNTPLYSDHSVEIFPNVFFFNEKQKEV